MAKVKSGLLRPKTEPRFKSRQPKVTVIAAHARGALLADVARTLQTAVFSRCFPGSAKVKMLERRRLGFLIKCRGDADHTPFDYLNWGGEY